MLHCAVVGEHTVHRSIAVAVASLAGRSMDPRITRVLAYLDTPPGLLSPVSDLSRSVNLSPSRLRHLFREQVSTSIGSYVRVKRLAFAKELLCSTFLSVKEIAAMTGFADEAYFVRTFRSTYAAPPGRFRHAAMSDNK